MLGLGRCFVGVSGVFGCVGPFLLGRAVAGWAFVGVERVPPWVVMLAVAVPAAGGFAFAGGGAEPSTDLFRERYGRDSERGGHQPRGGGPTYLGAEVVYLHSGYFSLPRWQSARRDSRLSDDRRNSLSGL